MTEIFTFEEECDGCKEGNTWNVLIVDDDRDVHDATKFALGSVRINGKCINFIDAYDGNEAIKVIDDDTHIDLILLDVVMESHDAGLRVAHEIRNVMNKKDIPAIILRTGQAGQFTDKELMDNPNFDTILPKSRASREVLIALLNTYLK